MKWHPIIFTSNMVRQILAGKKTMTRRVIKRQPFAVRGIDEVGHGPWKAFGVDGCCDAKDLKCPYGEIGGMLWVKETYRPEELDSGLDGVRYAADDSFIGIENTFEAVDRWVDMYDNGKYGDSWRNCMFMKRWASRIDLRITDEVVQRVGEISQFDACKEGADPSDAEDGIPNYRGGFIHEWNSINSKRGYTFDDKLFVFGIEFEIVNIRK